MAVWVSFSKFVYTYFENMPAIKNNMAFKSIKFRTFVNDVAGACIQCNGFLTSYKLIYYFCINLKSNGWQKF